MPFDGSEPASKSVRMLGLMEEFFDDGKNWTKGIFRAWDGRLCLMGAVWDARECSGIRGDRTEYYLHRAIRERIKSPSGIRRYEQVVMYYNDRCEGYEGIAGAIRRARELAREAARSNPARHARRAGGAMGTPA
jgi:hypothetical protein